MNQRSVMDDLRTMGPFEGIMVLWLIAFIVLLALAIFAGSGPLVSAVEWCNEAQANLNQRLFGRPTYHRKVTVLGLALGALIPYLVVRTLERRGSRR